MARKPNSRDRLKKIQTALYLEPEQFAALNAIHERTRIPKAVLVREGVDYVLNKYKKELKT